MSQSSFFTLVVSGQIESAHLPEYDNLYCKFAFEYGADFVVLEGIEEGISQLAKGQTSTWNFPIDIAWKSTNYYGWPQLLIRYDRVYLSVYGLDEFGRDVVRGYGSYRIPVSAGRLCTIGKNNEFVPIATSPFNNFYAWITGRLPEFLDPKFAAKNAGREGTFVSDVNMIVTRVRSQGTAKIIINVITKDVSNCGYVNRKEP